MAILVFNAGSSTLKYSLFNRADEPAQLAGNVSLKARSAKGCQEAVDKILSALSRFILQKDLNLIVGHRVVHGGVSARESVVINEKIKDQIESLVDLAPLHNRSALDVIRVSQKSLPAATHVAVFDTAFYASLPPCRYIYPLPYAWYKRWGIRRFGFHGISHAYCLTKAAELLSRLPTQLNLVTCHLGSGSSVTAIENGVAIDTTMGFTPMEGLMMGSRSGSVDPGILLYVQKEKGLSLMELEDILNFQSGLVGVSGISSDYRKVEVAAEKGNENASLALEIYADRVRSAIGSMFIALKTIDAIVFTGGIGENSAQLRARVCHGLSILGIYIDENKNQSLKTDADIRSESSRISVLVVHTQEEQMIAQEAARLLCIIE